MSQQPAGKPEPSEFELMVMQMCLGCRLLAHILRRKHHINHIPVGFEFPVDLAEYCVFGGAVKSKPRSPVCEEECVLGRSSLGKWRGLTEQNLL